MRASAADPRSSRGTEVAWFAACVVASLVLTWPLATVFSSRLCGDLGDPWQTLWGMRWVRDAVTSFRNPFFTDRVYYPTGATLIFQTFDLPSAIATIPLWNWLPAVAIYNVAVVLAIAVSAYGMFRLVRELTADPTVALGAGIVFAAVPYQFAHLQGHLHLLAMGWVPLFLVHLLRLMNGTGRLRDGALGGLFLGLGSLASWYHLLYAGVLVAVLLAYALVARRLTLPTRRTVTALLVLGVVWLALAGPLLAAMLRERARGPLTGAHDPAAFSADLYAFALPNAAQRWRGAFGTHSDEWGNPAEAAVYVGYTTLALAVVGVWTTAAARPFFVAAVVGAVLALGPTLNANGQVFDVALPYALLERIVPLLALAGVPVRFGYVMYFGLVVAAAYGLAALGARAAVGGGRPARTLAVVVPVALVLVEYWPRPLITTVYAVPAPMRAWAEDPATFAVLDVWDSYRPMWHATVHRKPMVGGYLSRVPERLEAAHEQHPVVRCILFGGAEAWIERVDPMIDFDWDGSGPAAMIAPHDFDVRWSGSLVAPVDGSYELWLEAEAGVVIVDGKPVVRRAGACRDEACVAHGIVALRAGRHALEVDHHRGHGVGRVRLWWQPPGGTRTIVPRQALRTRRGVPGLDAEYQQAVEPRSGLGSEGGRVALRALGVRYVVTHESNRCVEQDLGLPLAYAGEDVRIYEVPPARPGG